MSTSRSAQSIVSALSAWWRDRSQASRQMEEITALSQEDLAEVAADCGVSIHDLLAIIQAGPHAADEMHAMLKALNIDEDVVEGSDRHVFHDMMATCAECGHKGRCQHDLRAGRAADNYVHYCPNAETINELRAMPEMLSE